MRSSCVSITSKTVSRSHCSQVASSGGGPDILDSYYTLDINTSNVITEKYIILGVDSTCILENHSFLLYPSVQVIINMSIIRKKYLNSRILKVKLVNKCSISQKVIYMICRYLNTGFLGKEFVKLIRRK